ncbi:gamma carbonic anhydrase family protein [Luteithermobacter gelatinilyticus]|uniref:gamma carbonic anhydrase family protein n=1 Tax=Luteithermobacter gelatinilyticus TaxID=2582913 RepID=UPI001AEFC7EC|nr:gamma carbonic anhydrase family protein [Luteithermobacter gelatinilyticus]|tara:strand:- start:6580 stop:7134 length:555 start_codon:yes stop_codon:yes gene_type:complete
MMAEVGKIVNGGGKIYPHNGIWPQIDETAFIAPGARIIGDVEIGPESSIWFNCVLRGDVNKIRIGARTNLQDGTVVHVESGGAATLIGDEVLVGHMALIHGTVIENGGFVGMGAMTMDNCYIESGGMLAAGALLSPGKRIGKGEMWLGRPAKYVRTLTEEAIKDLRAGTDHYAALAQDYLGEYR